MNTPQESRLTFDTYAAEYDKALAQGLAVSGEDKHYFARGRVKWLVECLGPFDQTPKAILDFGCGTGAGARYLKELLPNKSVVGVDVSPRSIEVAEQACARAGIQFHLLKDFTPAGQIDLAFCNGVFHHIPPAERTAAVQWVWRCLCAGGLFSFWENNPWNPGTRYVMKRIPFDRDAIPLSPPTARRLLLQGGFETLRTDFRFFFPRWLAWFRPLERILAKLPLGAQYQVLARKPTS